MTPRQVRRIDTTSAVPLYQQLSGILRERVTAHEWLGGTRIPAEIELCEAYGVSRITVRQAVALLVRDGLLVRQRGKGTFVREPNLIAAPRSVSSFSTEITDLGMRPGSRILDADRVPASAEDAEAMGLQPGTPLYRIRRLRTADDRPIGIQLTQVLASRCEGLLDVLHDEMSLYTVLRDYFGIVATGATEVFRATAVGRGDSSLLECRIGQPGFHVVRTTFDNSGVFERTSSTLHGDRYQIRIALRNA